jgi:hypothetical protein
LEKFFKGEYHRNWLNLCLILVKFLNPCLMCLYTTIVVKLFLEQEFGIELVEVKSYISLLIHIGDVKWFQSK